MNRLTKQWGKDNVNCVATELDYLCLVGLEEHEFLAFDKIVRKLAYYEDLEESGLLLKLPYPVGTPLFIPCRKQGVKQDHIRRWQTNNKGLMFCSNGSFYVVDAIGKTVFLTREEAELKLKEIQNESM